MKNMIVLKNLPSNLVEEAIIILKENNKIHKYQNIDIKEEKEENEEKEEEKTGYIVKDAEMIIKSYIEKIENNSPKKERNIKRLERKYKNSIKLNFLLFFSTLLGIILTVIF